MAVELGEGQATPEDEKRRDNNISISFSFEKYTFFRILKMFSTYPLRLFWLSNNRVWFSEKLDPNKFPCDRIRNGAPFKTSWTRLIYIESDYFVGPDLTTIRPDYKSDPVCIVFD